MLISKALPKYGYSKFRLEILEYCEPKQCLAREQDYIDRLKPEYNILLQAGSPLGYRHTEAAKDKIRKAAKKRFAENPDSLAKGTAASVAARSKAALVTNIETGKTLEFPTQSQAAIELGVSGKTITKYIKSGKALKGLYHITTKVS